MQVVCCGWLGKDLFGFLVLCQGEDLFNQRAVTAYNEQIDSGQFATFESPNGLPFYLGAPAYSAYEHPYDWKGLLNTDGIALGSQYGKPHLYQLSRNIRLGLRFTF